MIDTWWFQQRAAPEAIRNRRFALVRLALIAPATASDARGRVVSPPAGTPFCAPTGTLAASACVPQCAQAGAERVGASSYPLAARCGEVADAPSVLTQLETCSESCSLGTAAGSASGSLRPIGVAPPGAGTQRAEVDLVVAYLEDLAVDASALDLGEHDVADRAAVEPHHRRCACRD